MKRVLETICLVLLCLALVLVEMMRINTPIASVYDLPPEAAVQQEQLVAEPEATPEATPETTPTPDPGEESTDA